MASSPICGRLALALWAAVLCGPVLAAPKAETPPDLGGVWSNRSLTRLERPPGVTDLVVPEAGVPALEHKLTEAVLHPPGDNVGQSEAEWYDDAHAARIDGQARSSWIVSPADGHVPYTPEARKLYTARRAAMTTAFEGPEARTASDRCLSPSWGALGPPMLNAPYAADYLIVQTPDAVAIMSEMNHEVRVIRLEAAHDPSIVPRWTGDSVGHWEGRTLVVDTVGLHPQEVFRAPPYLMSVSAHVTERFTRISPTEIRYEFTVEDPALLTEPLRGEMPFLASKDRIFEYACHEGNYSMRGILAGARRVEADARAKGRGQ